MTSESLIIRNFGPIHNIELDTLHRFNIFIGESGCGKSTVMKVLAMMRWVYKMFCIRTYMRKSGVKNSPFRLRTDRILGLNGMIVYAKPDSEIIYRNRDFTITLRNGKISSSSKYVSQDDLTLQKVAYISDKRVMVPDLAAGNVALRHNMFYLEETFLNFQKALDYIPTTDMDYLGVKMTVKKTAAGRRVFVSSLDNEKGKHFENLPLTNASSGLQSSVALHFITKYFSKHFDIVDSMNRSILRYLADNDSLSSFKATSDIGAFPHKRISLHLEEPELSLFPKNQWGLMSYIFSECFDSGNTEMDLTFATHSPYIITAINIMILAGRASAFDCNYPQFHAIPKLPFDQVGAWHIANGEAQSMINPDLQMVDGTMLDSTSDYYDDIIAEFNQILYE